MRLLCLLLALAAIGPCAPESARYARPRTLRVPSVRYMSIQAAVDSARYGDTIRVAPGVYREHLTLHSGVALVGPGAVVDGSDAGIEKGAAWLLGYGEGAGPHRWPEGREVGATEGNAPSRPDRPRMLEVRESALLAEYVAPMGRTQRASRAVELAGEPAGTLPQVYSLLLPPPYFSSNFNLPLVWRDSLLFYRFDSDSSLQQGIAHTPYWSGPIAEGWWAWTDRVLTVRSLDDPARHVWHVCPWSCGIYLRACDDVLIRGFTIRYFRFGVYMSGCRRVRVEGCTLLTPFGVRSGDSPTTEFVPDTVRASYDNAVVGCVFRSPPAMTYAATKGTWQETAGVSILSGSRWLIEGNRVSENHDGIQCSADSSIIRVNYVHDLNDDGIEVDGEGREIAIAANRVERTNNGISLAPITVGMTYVLSDTIATFIEQAFKMDPWDSVRVMRVRNVVNGTVLP